MAHCLALMSSGICNSVLQSGNFPCFRWASRASSRSEFPAHCFSKKQPCGLYCQLLLISCTETYPASPPKKIPESIAPAYLPPWREPPHSPLAQDICVCTRNRSRQIKIARSRPQQTKETKNPNDWQRECMRVTQAAILNLGKYCSV